MFSKLIYRLAQAADIPQIQIVRHSVKENTLSDPSLVTDKDCEEFILKRGRGWVCEVDGKIVGFSIVDLQEKNIWALFVKPEFEKKGIGRKLHNMMLNWYFKQTTETVWLGTSPATRAEKFYTKAGWRFAGDVNKGEVKFEMTHKDWENNPESNETNSTTLSSEKFTIKINSFGAEVCSIKNKNNLEYIWQADKNVWARHAPVLFPIVGRLKNNQFVFDNKTYTLPQHGFARDMNFELVSESLETCTFQLVSNQETKTNFPFEFSFEIKYELNNNLLTTSYSVKNPSEGKLFFSVGAHPAFNCPLLPGENFEDYFLEFEAGNYTKTLLKDGLLSTAKTPLTFRDKKLFLTPALFDNDALIFENNQVNKIGLFSSKSSHGVELSCKNWPFFGIWSKKGTTQFVCLEPWQGITDAESTNQQIVSKKGIIELGGLSEFNCSYSVCFY